MRLTMYFPGIVRLTRAERREVRAYQASGRGWAKIDRKYGRRRHTGRTK